MKKIFLSLMSLIFAFYPSSSKAQDDFFDNLIVDDEIETEIAFS